MIDSILNHDHQQELLHFDMDLCKDIDRYLMQNHVPVDEYTI
jgi:hypothetical protein